jgi:hypothetical protein
VTRVYRLHVTYPEGSHAPDGIPVAGWYPADWQPGGAYLPEEWPAPFSWPRVHLYLSKSGAEKRAKLFHSFGATVEIEESRPVEWEASP